MIFKSHFTSVEENVKMRRFLGLRTGHETIMTKMGFPDMDFIPRHAAERIIETMEDRPVVLLNGTRQTGKSTLIKWICTRKNISYYMLDDLTILSSAKNIHAGPVRALWM